MSENSKYIFCKFYSTDRNFDFHFVLTEKNATNYFGINLIIKIYVIILK